MPLITTFCGHCATMNRIPESRLGDKPICGGCHQPLMSGLPLAGTGENFQRLIDSDLPVLVDFWASWCGPCQQFAPLFRSLAAELEPNYRLVKVDTEQEPDLAHRFGIRSIPTLMLFRQGHKLGQLTGAVPKTPLLEWLRSLQ